MSASEFAAKHARVASWLAERRVDAVLLALPANVAWLACGGDLHRRHGPRPVVALGPERAFLLCGSDDADRVRQEEVRGLALDVVPMLFTSGEAAFERARSLLPDARIWRTDAAGLPVDRDPSLDTLRRALLAEEVERLVRLARDAAAAVEEVAAECYRGITERDAAARLGAECLRRQIAPREILAGADDRLDTYVRPVPKGTTAERTLLLALVASRGGLHAAVARTLCLTRPPQVFVDRFRANLEISARLCHATRAGDTLGGAVHRALPQTPVHLGGLGGTTGYAYPEQDARGSSTFKLVPPQALVWSVASAGARAEDTYVLDNTGITIASVTEGWPRRALRVGGSVYELPDLLQL